MTFKPTLATRRALLVAAAVLPAAAILTPAEHAKAAGVTPKANVKFQYKPNGANECGKCNYFIPGANPTAVGQCKVVAGPIPPNGWCILFAAKHA
ncbi:MAG: hypothetical protein ACYDD1_06475 [Caulobacteraceae bacterium]